MKTTSTGLLAAVAGVVALNVVQQRANAGLREEARALVREYQVIEPLRAENQRLAVQALGLVSTTEDAAELARLRSQADELRKVYSAKMPYMWRGPHSVSRDTPPDEKLEILVPEGRSTPMKSWQTMLRFGRGQFSTAVSSDELLDMHALMYCLDEQASARVAEFLMALPDEARGRFHSPERLLATVFDQWLWRGDPPRGYGGGKGGDVFIDGDPSRALTHWRITFTSGKVQEIGFPFKRFDDGWRYGPLTEVDVEQMLSLLNSTTGDPKEAPNTANLGPKTR